MSCIVPREQIKLFCPALGKLKIAEKLAWAGMPNLPVAALRTGRENRKERGEQWRRPQESGERRSEFVWLSSLHSPALLPQGGNGGGREDSKRVSELGLKLPPTTS
jgi:hypothetical protein